MTEQLSLFCHRTGAIEQDAAAGQQLLAFARQQKPAPDTIEQPQAEFVLEIDDLPRQGGLGYSQAQGCLGDGAELGHGYEGSRTPQVHARL